MKYFIYCDTNQLDKLLLKDSYAAQECIKGEKISLKILIMELPEKVIEGVENLDIIKYSDFEKIYNFLLKW